MNRKRNHLTLIGCIYCGLTGLASAAISVHGSSTAYTETGGDWQSMGTNDIDTSGGLGTDGYVFFGVFNGTNTSSVANGGEGPHDYATGSASGSFPAYVTANSGGSNFSFIADEFSAYGVIDDPNFTDGTDTLGGFAAGTDGAAGTDRELINFTVFGLAVGQTVRVGVLGGLASGDGRWDSTSITLSDGASSATVGDHATSPLAINPGGVEAGWVFFDIDADGDYIASATKRLDTQSAGIGGLTFDSIIIPEPSSALLLGVGLAAFALRRRKTVA